MNQVQEYLRKKRIKESGLPKIWIVKSDRNGVELPVERQVTDIKKAYTVRYYADGRNVLIDKYFIDEAPYELEFEQGNTSTSIDGYASGVGDLWHWTYFAGLSEKNANEFYLKEITRINEKYK